MAVFALSVGGAGVVSCRRTQQDGHGGHHAAAQREHDAAGRVGAVGRLDGDEEIECIQDPGRTQQRGQHGEEGGDSAALAAFALAAAAAARSRLGRLLGPLQSLSSPLGAPQRQLHALRRGPDQRPTLVGGAVQSGGSWTPSRRVCAVGNVSLRGRGWTADAVFRGSVQIARCDDGSGNSLIQLPLLRLIRSRLLGEVVSGLLVAGSAACSKQSRAVLGLI